MDPPSNIRSGGLKFAERQMLRHGWTEGKGLGKREDGISEAIKVKVKCDTAGVGHNSAEQFTFHWWDHVFNKTASSISVEPDQDGVTVKKLSEDGGTVSSKKPRKAMLRSNMLYGRFIKSATLMSGGEKPMEEPSSSDTSDSSEDEDSKLDLSSATKLSDEDLMKICGGRTAHKGARHGLTMSAKLSRIEEQERAFMEKYGKKETKLQPSMSEVRSTEECNRDDNIRSKKKKLREGNVIGEEENNLSDAEATKKKKKQKKYEKLSGDVPNGHEQHHVPSMEEDTRTSKKKRSKVPENVETEVLDITKNDTSVEGENNRPKKKRKTGDTFKGHTEDCIQSTEDGDSRHEKDEEYENAEEAGKSKKKKRKPEEKFSGQWTEDGDSRHEQEDKESEHTDEARKSKKKKKNKRTKDHEELAEELTACSEEKQSRKSKNKKVEEEHDPCTEEEEDRSRRKKRTLVDNEDEPEEEEDAKATKKKKKSKRKDRKD